MIFSYLLNMQSHPSWVCGLKLSIVGLALNIVKSHPSWVCGLKRSATALQKYKESHTLRGCVDWNQDMKSKRNLRQVTPFVGVWIETRRLPVHCTHHWVTPFVGVWIETPLMWRRCETASSHPSWVCGLKPDDVCCPPAECHVTPFVGVWIETRCHVLHWCVCCVTPFVGVWIETLPPWSCIGSRKSHPSWVCGLKQVLVVALDCAHRHTLRGCVDWNRRKTTACAILPVTPFVGVWIETAAFVRMRQHIEVTPFVGVWIETVRRLLYLAAVVCHTLRGCVDWNRTNVLIILPATSHTLRGCVDWNYWHAAEYSGWS